jgi:hypothetical protein
MRLWKVFALSCKIQQGLECRQEDSASVCGRLIYAIEIPRRLLSWNLGGRLVGLFQFITGIWLMYCTYAITVDLVLGAKVWV